MGTESLSLVIFKAEHLSFELTYGEVPENLYGLMNKGWIDESLFFFKLFNNNIPPAHRVFLLLDGHKTH